MWGQYGQRLGVVWGAVCSGRNLNMGRVFKQPRVSDFKYYIIFISCALQFALFLPCPSRFDYTIIHTLRIQMMYEVMLNQINGMV